MESAQRLQQQEWGDLIARTAQGDQAALALLYDRTSPWIFGMVMRILGSREAAEEVTLEVYVQVWRQAALYDRQRGSPAGWLTTLARTRAIDRFRADYLEKGRQTPLESAAELPSSEHDPEEDSVGREHRRMVQSALAALPPEQREAIALAYFWGLSQSEIAERLQTPLGTIKTRIRMGMLKLREHLAPYEEGLAL
ncbi:MAG TPA: sigma-70 family RNA polymerase sigma factor [Nitrospiraceae bacterium]|nr:sigma-70 family RNA polymerase sigma factor [Nitrospiraceae bacterium]